MRWLLVALVTAFSFPANAQMVQMPVPCVPLSQKRVFMDKEGMTLIASAKSRRNAKMELWRSKKGTYAIVHVVRGLACFVDFGDGFNVSDGG